MAVIRFVKDFNGIRPELKDIKEGTVMDVEKTLAHALVCRDAAIYATDGVDKVIEPSKKSWVEKEEKSSHKTKEEKAGTKTK